MIIDIRGKMAEKNYALCFKALGDETRLKIIKMLAKGSMCGCKILEYFDITQPTLSYHMKMLVDTRLVIATKSGKWYHYQLNKELFDELALFLITF